MKKLIYLIIFTLFLNSCQTLQETEEFELRQFKNETVESNYTSGTFFFIVGGYSSKTETKDIVKLIANIDGVYRFLEFKLERLRIKIDNSITTPTIQIFYYDESKRTNDFIFRTNTLNYYGTYVVLRCPEIYIPEDLTPIKI